MNGKILPCISEATFFPIFSGFHSPVMLWLPRSTLGQAINLVKCNRDGGDAPENLYSLRWFMTSFEPCLWADPLIKLDFPFTISSSTFAPNDLPVPSLLHPSEFGNFTNLPFPPSGDCFHPRLQWFFPFSFELSRKGLCLFFFPAANPESKQMAFP